MANTLTNSLPRIIAMGMLALRKRAIGPRLVNSDYGRDAQQKGNAVNIPIPVAQTADDVTPGPVPPTPANTTPGTVQIPLDQWKKTNFHLTDKELAEIAWRENFLPGQATEAFEGLASLCNAFIWSKAALFNGTVATVSRPFSSTANAGATVRSVIQQLGDNRVPLGNRRVVMDPTTEGDAVALDWFRAADQAGTDATIRDAVIGHRMGMDWAMDQQCGRSFTNVAGSTFVINNSGGYPAGTKTFVVGSGTGALTAGMSIKFANHGSTYNVVTAPASGTSGAMTIGGRGLRELVIDTEAITLVDAASTAVVTQIPVFHRDAIAFVNRPVSIDTELARATSNIIVPITDPTSGLSITMEVRREYHQWTWELSMLYGAACVIPEYGVKISYT